MSSLEHQIKEFQQEIAEIIRVYSSDEKAKKSYESPARQSINSGRYSHFS